MSEPAPKLLDQVRHTLRVKHYSIRTEGAYTDWIKRFILFHHKRHPQEMGCPEIEAFLTHLAFNRLYPKPGPRRPPLSLPRGPVPIP